MLGAQVENSKNIGVSENSSHEFLLRFARIEAYFGFGYSFILLYLGAIFSGFVLLITTLIFYPAIKFLNKHRHETSARLLLISGGLIYIHSVKIGIKFDLNADFYFLPVMMLSLLLFDVRQKREVVLGIGLPLIVWIMGKWGGHPTLPSSWTPTVFPDEIFRNLSFVGSFAVTAIFLNLYRKHILALKETVEKDLEKTKEIERKLQSAQRLSKLGNWELDLINNKLSWSDEIYRIFEIDKDQFEASYEAFLGVIHPDDRDAVNAAYTESMATRGPYEIVHRLLMPDGRIKFVREHCETTYSHDFKPLISLGTIQDISEAKRNDAKLLYSSKMAALGEMAGGIAHEINSPLTIIQGKASQILRKVNVNEFSPESYKADLEKIVSTVERISKIINGLRAISRNAEADSMKQTNVQKIIEDVLDLSMERFKYNSVDLSLDISNSMQIMCRSSEINQVLLNLLNNSFDAVLDLKEKWIEIKTIESGPNIKIIVTDSGSGIEPGVVEKLMQPFFSTKEVGKGTGLGLNISKRIIEKHNGSLYYDPESKNTCFVLEIPLCGAHSDKESNFCAQETEEVLKAS